MSYSARSGRGYGSQRRGSAKRSVRLGRSREQPLQQMMLSASMSAPVEIDSRAATRSKDEIERWSKIREEYIAKGKPLHERDPTKPQFEPFDSRLKGQADFLGSCDHFRQTPEGENQWQIMMQTRKQISEEEFLKKVDVKDVLDEGETWKEYKEVAKGEGSPLEFYESSNGLVFFQTAGFEFIWKL